MTKKLYLKQVKDEPPRNPSTVFRVRVRALFEWQNRSKVAFAFVFALDAFAFALCRNGPLNELNVQRYRNLCIFCRSLRSRGLLFYFNNEIFLESAYTKQCLIYRVYTHTNRQSDVGYVISYISKIIFLCNLFA